MTKNEDKEVNAPTPKLLWPGLSKAIYKKAIDMGIIGTATKK